MALMTSNSIFLNRVTEKIAAILPDTRRKVIRQAILGFGDSFLESPDAVARGDVLAAVSDSIAEAFILVVTAAALSLVLSLFMMREKLSSERSSAT